MKYKVKVLLNKIMYFIIKIVVSKIFDIKKGEDINIK